MKITYSNDFHGTVTTVRAPTREPGGITSRPARSSGHETPCAEAPVHLRWRSRQRGSNDGDGAPASGRSKTSGWYRR